MQNKIKITIVEDDYLIADFLCKAITNVGYQVIDVCNSYDSCLISIRKFQPDLMLIDIKIEGGRNGIAIAEHINKNYQIPFIYISSLKDRDTIEAATKTLPASYLLKPFEEDDLYISIEMALFNHAQRNPKNKVLAESIVFDEALFIKQKNSFLKINKAEIIYIEAKDNYIKIQTDTNNFLVRQTINEVEKCLPDYFFRIHRSFICNLNFIETISNEKALLKNKISLSMNKFSYNKLKAFLPIL
jgi:DNA-binding LytR/AlgR family response regulator